MVFSEPFDLASVNTGSVYLAQGTTKVACGYAIAGDHRSVTLTPNAPLTGFTLYKLVVTTGVKDLVGRPLPTTYVSTFTTVDNVPPAVTSVAPAAGAVQVPLDGVVRLTFSEAVNPAALDGIVLLQGGAPVAVRLDLVQEGRVAILTPLMQLAANQTYTVSVAGVRDLPGNVMAGSFSSIFATLDTIVPTVTALDLAAGSKLIAGNDVTVSAAVADGDVAFVDFSVDDALAANDRSAPFAATLHLDRAGSVTIKAVAQDLVGNRGPAKLLMIDVAADQPPGTIITAPDTGTTVDSAAALNVTVQAQDDLGVKTITLNTSGALNFSQTHTVSGPAPSTSFTLTVPAQAAPGSVLTLKAVATDSIGQISPVAVTDLTVRDATLPSLTLSSPGETVLYQPGETGSATIVASDNHALTALDCAVLGAASGSFSETIDPPRRAWSAR